MTYDEWRQFKIDHQRDLVGDVQHPNDCPKLTIHGVEFAIPSRKPLDVIFKAVFSGDDVEIAIQPPPQLLEWPEIPEVFNEMLELIEQYHGEKTDGEIDISCVITNVKFLEKCCKLAAKALRRQYDLSDADLGQMIEFTLENNKWLPQLLGWCA